MPWVLRVTATGFGSPRGRMGEHTQPQFKKKKTMVNTCRARAVFVSAVGCSPLLSSAESRKNLFRSMPPMSRQNRKLRASLRNPMSWIRRENRCDRRSWSSVHGDFVLCWVLHVQRWTEVVFLCFGIPPCVRERPPQERGLQQTCWFLGRTRLQHILF